MSASERDKLLTLLLENSGGKELVNIKFFRGNAADLTVERMCAAARRVLEASWAGAQKDEPPVTRRAQVTAATLFQRS